LIQQGSSAPTIALAPETMASPRRECLARRSSEALVQAKPWHGLVAGCIAGASGVVIGHAFDTAKVQAQVSSGSDSSTSSSSKPRALRSVLSLYRGIVPPLLSTGAVRSLYFGVYETFKPLVSTAMGKDSTSLPVVFIAGAMTGAVIAPVTAPVQRLKIMQQVEGGSLQEVCKRLLASGASGLFRGLAVHCVLETIGSGCYLLAYAAAKQVVTAHISTSGGGDGNSGDTSSSASGSSVSSVGDSVPRQGQEPLSVRIGCGMVAGCCGWISIYPLDVVRSRVMAVGVAASAGGNGSSSAFALVSAAARDTYASGGLLAFYRGLGFTMLRAAPVAGTVLPVYDLCKAWLAAAAERSGSR